MKSQFILILPAMLFAPVALAQGPLAPSGAPAPSMKSLDQIESRTAIPKSPAVPIAGPHFIISQPGSYYLTGNIEVVSGNGIEIAASDVSLDLNGFALVNTTASPASGDAIHIAPGVGGIEIRNGRITGGTVRTFTGPKPWNATYVGKGWHTGIRDDSLSPSEGMILSSLTVKKCSSSGITHFGKGVLRDVTSTSNGSFGIVASGSTIIGASAKNNGGIGIAASGGSVANSVATGNATVGISADQGSVSNSTASANGAAGFSLLYGSGVNVTAADNGGFGIQASAGSVTGATVSTNGSDGIYAIQGNVATTNAYSNAGHGINASVVTESRATNNLNSGIIAGGGVVAHCVASGNDTGGGAVDKQISVTAGTGQRVGCVPVSE